MYPVIQVRASGAELSNSLVLRCDDAPAGLGIEFQGRSVALGVICRDHKVTGSTIRGFEDGIVMRLGAMKQAEGERQAKGERREAISGQTAS